MKRLKASDQRKVAGFVRALYGPGSLQSISERTVQGLHGLIGANNVVVTHIDHRSGMVTTLADTVGPEILPFYPAASALKHQHPGFQHHRGHPDGRATALADVISLYQWKRTGIYNEVLAKLGMHEQLGVQLPFGQPDYFGITVSRSRRTFTERDRQVLNVLRHHVAEAFRTATSLPALPSLPLLEALESLVGGSLIALDLMGAVQFSSDLAQKHLEAFFPEERPFQGGIPPTVRRWVTREMAAFASPELAIRPPQSWVIQRGNVSLHLRLASNHDGTAHVLVLRVEGPAYDIAKLRALNFGSRATEVLYWLGQGKSNEEIGLILGMSTQTVKGHLKGIFARLGVENRASATAMISTFLARP